MAPTILPLAYFLPGSTSPFVYHKHFSNIKGVHLRYAEELNCEKQEKHRRYGF